MTDKKRSYNQGNKHALKDDSLQASLSLRISNELKSALTALAAKQGQSINAMVNDALAELVEYHSDNDDRYDARKETIKQLKALNAEMANLIKVME